MNAKDLKSKLEKDKIEFILAQFVDIHGVAKTKSVPVAHFNTILEGGAGFAAFAVDGLGLPPHGPDFMAIGDPTSYRTVPWMPGYARIVCNGHINGKPHAWDSRVVCQKLMAEFTAATGLEFFTGLEPEFFLLRRDEETREISPWVDTDTLKKPCYDYRGFNRASEILGEISKALIDSGVDVYQIDHEDANGQFEINYTFANAVKTADDFVFIKMAGSEVARKHGAICSFMPKPFADRPGSGMHMHMSAGKVGKNSFHDESDKNGLGLSEIAYQFLGGLFAHAQALTAIACPTVNSYKRLTASGSISGATWAPTSICYGDNNRTAMVRIPHGRIELRVPDAAANPYLLTAAVLAAGLDGIKRKLSPGNPVNQNLYEMTGQQKSAAGIGTLPSDLPSALAALSKDNVLQAALGEGLVRDFIALKTQEQAEYHSRVSKWEIERYLDFY